MDRRAAITACEQAERDYSDDQAADFSSVKVTRYPVDDPAYLVTGYAIVHSPYFPIVRSKWTCLGSIGQTGDWVGSIMDPVNGTPPILDRP